MVGVTVMEVPVPPGFHAYVVAPEPVSTIDAPLHIVGLFADMFGFGLTVTIACVLFVQPTPLVPVTRYVVVMVGVTVIEVPVPPGFHVYVVAPEPVSTIDAPLQIVGLFADTFGFGLTVTIA